MLDSLPVTLPEDPKEAEKVFSFPEREELKRQHLLAFQDFCLDLFEEEYGKIPPGSENRSPVCKRTSYSKIILTLT